MTHFAKLKFLVGCFAFLMAMGCEAIDSGEFENSDDLDFDGRVATTGHTSNNLVPNGQLTLNQYLQSSDGSHRFYLQGDGNLVLRRMSDQKPLWASGTNGKSVKVFRFKTGGDLVLQNASGSTVWSSKTDGSNATNLHLHSAGKLVLYRNSAAVWSTNGASDPVDPPDNGIGPSQGRKSYNGLWGGKQVTLRDVWANNWSGGLASREKYLLVSNNDSSQSQVKAKAQQYGFSVLGQEGDNDSGATLLQVGTNSKKDGLNAILNVGKITITAVTTDATLKPDGGGKQDGEDARRQAFGSTDNTNTGGGVYHLDIKDSEDGVTIWDRDHPCSQFRGGFMYLRWE